MKQSKKSIALQTKETKTYKVNITPCSPFDGHDGKGENVVITTNDIRTYKKNISPINLVTTKRLYV